jgi:hypothetical protein
MRLSADSSETVPLSLFPQARAMEAGNDAGLRLTAKDEQAPDDAEQDDVEQGERVAVAGPGDRDILAGCLLSLW